MTCKENHDRGVSAAEARHPFAGTPPDADTTHPAQASMADEGSSEQKQLKKQADKAMAKAWGDGFLVAPQEQRKPRCQALSPKVKS